MLFNEELENTNQESTAEDSNLIQEETQEATEQEQEQEVKTKKTKEDNIRALREKAEKQEKEIEEYKKYFAQMNQPKQQQTAEEDYNLSPDDLVEAKHLKKYEQKIQKLEEQLTEQKLKSEFPDFDKVVNQENLERLAKSYPAIANTLKAPGNLYDKAVSAYTMLRNFGIYQEDTFENDRVRAQNNFNKPRPLTSVSPQQGDSPLSKANAFANGLTEDLKQQLWKEMNDLRKKS